jgi:allantoinase
MAELAVRSQRVVSALGERPAAVVIAGGRIAAVVAPDAVPDHVHVLDVGAAAVLPGVVDSHVHVNEPGRTEWEGFASATRAAAAGGVTTIVDMPLNSIPVTTSVAALEAKIAAARGRVHVDCAFWGGVVPGNAAELSAMLDAGVRGFKAFLIDSGIDDFPASGEAELRAALALLSARQAPLLVHAELASCQAPTGGAPFRYATYLASRPRQWENDAVAMLVSLAREYRTPLHVVHLSSADPLGLLGEARASGVPVTVETCPHYLRFDAEAIPDSRTEFKCAPPIRERANREALWAGLRAGIVDMVVSDHSPCTPAQKGDGDFMTAWGGIASLQFALQALWTEASERGFTLSDLARWTSERPAALAGLGHRKGRLAPGYDADLVIFDPDAAWVFNREDVRHRHRLSPYLGEPARGVVRATYLRGRRVHPQPLTAAPQGELILEPRHGLR